LEPFVNKQAVGHFEPLLLEGNVEPISRQFKREEALPAY
jgi:hypothetical protein